MFGALAWRYTLRATSDAVNAENGKPAFTPNQLGTADLGPEKSREIEFGFDASALDGRLGLVVTHFSQITDAALVPVIQPPSLGFSASQLVNVGTLENSGTEVTITGELVRLNNVNLKAKLGGSVLHSNAKDVGGQTLTIYALGRTYVKEGLPVPALSSALAYFDGYRQARGTANGSPASRSRSATACVAAYPADV